MTSQMQDARLLKKSFSVTEGMHIQYSQIPSIFETGPILTLREPCPVIHGLGIRKEVTTYFPVFPGRILGLSYAPLKFSKEKNL